MSKILKLLLKLLLFLVLSALLAAGGLWSVQDYLSRWSEKPVPLSQKLELDFKRGTGLRSLSKQLESAGLIDNQLFFEAWMRLHSTPRKLQAGNYLFDLPEYSPSAVAKKIIAGDIYQPVLFEITVPEGFSVEKIFERIVSKLGSSAEEIKAAEKLVLSELKKRVPEAKSLEGFLYPATFRFYETPSAENILRKQLETFFERLPASYEAELSKLELSLYEAVTFASLIELETSLDSERFFVSEVIWNRLKKKMALGIDAAIIYGIEDYQGDIKFKHLRDKSNPYNLRHRRGLPPTPICSPSLASLEAVLTPSDKGYFYYVLKVGSSKEHHFSKNFKEHQSWVRKLVRSQRAK